MTELEQQIALCEWMGWKPYHQKGNVPWLENPEFHSPDGKFCLLEDLPNTNSLDVLHEMEKRLKGDMEDPSSEVSRWKEQLMFACGDGKDPWNCNDVDLFRATATQRREALLKTLNLWKD